MVTKITRTATSEEKAAVKATQKEIVLFDSQSYFSDEYLAELKQSYSDVEEKENLTDEYIRDIAQEDLNDSYRDILNSLDRFAYAVKGFDFFLVGSAGTWQGRKNAFSRGTDESPKDLILSDFSHCNDIKIAIVDNELKITGYHHDGRDYMTLKRINLRAERIPPIVDSLYCDWYSYIQEYDETGYYSSNIGKAFLKYYRGK